MKSLGIISHSILVDALKIQIFEGQNMNKEISDSVILDFCKLFLSNENYEKINKKIKHNKQTGDDLYTEIIIGAILGYLGLIINYEPTLMGKTPDWTVLDKEQNIIGIVECTQLYIDYTTEKKTSFSDCDKPSVVVYWIDGERNNTDRLYEKLSEKASKYRKLVKKEKIEYIIAVYINAKLVFFNDEIKPLLYDDCGFFNEFPDVDGVIFVSEIGSYIFKFQYWNKSKSIAREVLPIELILDLHKK